MMPDYVAFPTRVLFALGCAGVTPGRTRPSRAWVLPSRAEGGKSSRTQPRRLYREKLKTTDNCL